jgi:hypothetical protein
VIIGQIALKFRNFMRIADDLGVPEVRSESCDW